MADCGADLVELFAPELKAKSVMVGGRSNEPGGLDGL
jgi:hypothetical protein